MYRYELIHQGLYVLCMFAMEFKRDHPAKSRPKTHIFQLAIIYEKIKSLLIEIASVFIGMSHINGCVRNLLFVTIKFN